MMTKVYDKEGYKILNEEDLIQDPNRIKKLYFKDNLYALFRDKENKTFIAVKLLGLAHVIKIDFDGYVEDYIMPFFLNVDDGLTGCDDCDLFHESPHHPNSEELKKLYDESERR